jgi:ribosomal protein S18 acetylase RimI-like enzyme
MIEEEKRKKRGGGEKPEPPLLPPLLFSSSKFHLRDATDDDVPEIANVIALAFEEHRGKLTPPSSSLNKTPEAVKQELQSAKAIVVVLNDKMIGCVFYSVREDFVYLAHLAVLPEQRGLGIARRLMLEVEQRTLEQHHTTIRLSVRLALEKTRGFYERMGYTFYSYGSHPGFSEPTHVTLEKHL